MRGDTIKNNHKIATMVIAALVFSLSAGASVSADSSVAWVDVTSGTTADLCGVWGPGSDLFATGESGPRIQDKGSACGAGGVVAVISLRSDIRAQLYTTMGLAGLL
jgi:hypothetical protein